MTPERRGAASAESAIQTRSLCKWFGRKAAVKNLTLEVPRGEVFGFLGPNGAGKSTCVKMLLGLVKPTAGSASVLGFPAGNVAARRRVGFLPEHFRFYDWLTPAELLRLHGRLYGMPAPLLAKRSSELLERVGLAAHCDKRIGNFSKGMSQRVGLAQALLDAPDLIILDEPTSGLDPGGRKLVRDLIKEESSRGATIFLNSHLLSEVEITCDRVAFVKHGEVLETRRIAGGIGEGEIRVRLRARNLRPETLDALAERVARIQHAPQPARPGIDGAPQVAAGEEVVAFTASSMSEVPEIVRCLVSQGVDIYEVTPERASLEDLFLRIVGREGAL